VVGRLTGAPDVRDDPTEPVPVVEETVSPLGLAIDAGRAFLCLGRGRRCFFIAYSCSLKIAGRRAKCPVLGCEAQARPRHGIKAFSADYAMPAPRTFTRWLSDGPDPRDLMPPFPADLMRMWPISTCVNKPENDDPSILDEIELAGDAA